MGVGGGVEGFEGDWAGYGRGGGLDFCSYFKKTFSLLFLKEKIPPLFES